MPIPEAVLKCIALFINVQVAVLADPYFDFFFFIPVIVLFFPSLFTHTEFLLGWHQNRINPYCWPQFNWKGETVFTLFYAYLLFSLISSFCFFVYFAFPLQSQNSDWECLCLEPSRSFKPVGWLWNWSF